MNRIVMTALVATAATGLAACGAVASAGPSSPRASANPRFGGRNGTSGELVQINGTTWPRSASLAMSRSQYWSSTQHSSEQHRDLRDIARWRSHCYWPGRILRECDRGDGSPVRQGQRRLQLWRATDGCLPGSSCVAAGRPTRLLVCRRRGDSGLGYFGHGDVLRRRVPIGQRADHGAGQQVVPSHRIRSRPASVHHR